MVVRVQGSEWLCAKDPEIWSSVHGGRVESHHFWKKDIVGDATKDSALSSRLRELRDSSREITSAIIAIGGLAISCFC